MRVAIVHDWLTGMRGGERLLEILCRLFPKAPIYTLFYFSRKLSPQIERHPIIRSGLQKYLVSKKSYRHYLPLFPSAIESFDFSGFDLIVSTSHAVAKGAVPGKNTLSICYCHTPMRYIWDRFDDYFGADRPAWLRYAALMFRDYLREWDRETASRVDHYIANSRFVADRIRSIYGRKADVINPPVDLDKFIPNSDPAEDFYLLVSANAPYKKIDLAIEAFSTNRKPLYIAGAGNHAWKSKREIPSNIRILSPLTDEELTNYYQRCRALVFPGVEDFGLTPLEAHACGKPVIGFAEGGLLETVIEGVNGHFFYEQTAEAMVRAVEEFEEMTFSEQCIRKRVEAFYQPSTYTRLKMYLESKLEQFGLPVKLPVSDNHA